MDKAILFGVFDFVNFHVCKTLLEKGIEVKGFHFENKELMSYLDEKRFEVGRNANFHDQSFLEWDDQLDSGATIVFSFYDLYMNYNEDILHNEAVKKPILEFFKNNQKKSIITAFILPAQMTEKSVDPKAFRNINEIINQLKEWAIPLQFIYLPTVYGTWQPETFLFQQAILSNMNQNNCFKETREWAVDAIFVEDAVSVILEICQSGIPGHFFLESGKKNQWQMCAHFLNMDKNLERTIKREALIGGAEMKRVKIKIGTSIKDSLTKQMEHLHRLLNQEL